MRYFVHLHATAGSPTHLMHQNGCVLFPDPETVALLGDFDGANEALCAARERYGAITGCRFCCPECHAPARAAAGPARSHEGGANGETTQ
jgi:hypothetical protein